MGTPGGLATEVYMSQKSRASNKLQSRLAALGSMTAKRPTGGTIRPMVKKTILITQDIFDGYP